MQFKNCECEYCKTYNFPTLWKLDVDLFWFEIPKNGSVAIKTKYNEREYISNMEQHINEVPFVFVRDPIERFISLFKHYFLPEGGKFKKGLPFFQKLGIDIFEIDTTDCITFLLDNLFQLGTDEEAHHFYPQSYFINYQLFPILKLVDIKNLSQTLKVPISNATNTSLEIGLNAEQELRVEAIYESDYLLFEKQRFEFLG